MHVLCTDSSILAGHNLKEIANVIQEIKCNNLNITILGNVNNFLNANIMKLKNDKLHLFQLYLIDQIIEQTHMSKATSKPIPAKLAVILHYQYHLPSHTPSFNCRSVIGKLDYLKQEIRSDMSYATHQYMCFSTS